MCHKIHLGPIAFTFLDWRLPFPKCFQYQYLPFSRHFDIKHFLNFFPHIAFIIKRCQYERHSNCLILVKSLFFLFLVFSSYADCRVLTAKLFLTTFENSLACNTFALRPETSTLSNHRTHARFHPGPHLSASRRISSRFCLLSSLRRSKSSMVWVQDWGDQRMSGPEGE